MLDLTTNEVATVFGGVCMKRIYTMASSGFSIAGGVAGIANYVAIFRQARRQDNIVVDDGSKKINLRGGMCPVGLGTLSIAFNSIGVLLFSISLSESQCND